ncbi:leucine-rich repeat domain-containing protein, partial [Myxococcota bacterium]
MTKRLCWILAVALIASACGDDEIETCTATSCGGDAYCSMVTSQCETELLIQDAALTACVREHFGNPGGIIPLVAAKTLTQLECANLDITSIHGLEALTGLRDLSLWENFVTDLSPLSRLTQLESLQLGNNLLRDVTPLQSLANLKRLGLADNIITDVGALAALSNLQWLNLDHNELTNIDRLVRLNELTWLTVEGNAIENPDVFNYLEGPGREVYKRRASELASARENVRATPEGLVDKTTPELFVDKGGEVYFKLELGDDVIFAIKQYAGDLFLEGNQLVYRTAARETVVGEVNADGWQLCSGDWARVCRFAIGR